MKQFVIIVTLIGTLLSLVNGAPWVVLDSRNDMLAMSSEVSETVVQYAPPSDVATTLRSKFDDEAVENVATERDDIAPVQTTEEQKLAVDAVPELEPAVRTSQDEQTTTVAPVFVVEELKSDDVVYASTTVPQSVPKLATVNDDVDEDNESKLVPDIPTMENRSNPNSVEENRLMVPQVVVVTKKKYDMFNEKKSKFSKIRFGM